MNVWLSSFRSYMSEVLPCDANTMRWLQQQQKDCTLCFPSSIRTEDLSQPVSFFKMLVNIFPSMYKSQHAKHLMPFNQLLIAPRDFVCKIHCHRCLAGTQKAFTRLSSFRPLKHSFSSATSGDRAQCERWWSSVASGNCDSYFLSVCFVSRNKLLVWGPCGRK